MTSYANAPYTICMFSNLFPPVVSGSSTQTAALSRVLAEKGQRVVVITAKVASTSPDYELADGVAIYRLPALRLPQMRIALRFPWLSYTFTPANLRRIRAILAEYNPDILHVHNHMFDLSLAAALLRRQTGIPMVLTLHTIIKHSVPAYNVLLYPIDRLALRYLMVRRADHIVSPDINMQLYAAEAFGRPDSVIVPYGIDLPPEPTPAAVHKIRERYGLAGKRVILSLGHLNDLRNRSDLIDAMPHVLEQLPNALLLIVGGIATQEPLRRVERLGLQRAVVFTDHVPHADIPAFLQAADLEAHWLNQDRPEHTSLGIASLEAMLAGKVVLAAASKLSYGPGVLKDGENIVIVSPGDPPGLARTILELLGDAARRASIGAHARETVARHFGWDTIAQQILDVYEVALAGRARRNARSGRLEDTTEQALYVMRKTC